MYAYLLFSPDMRETPTWSLPVPRLATRAKIRWDDTRLYVGAYIEETDLWGVITEDEKPSKVLIVYSPSKTFFVSNALSLGWPETFEIVAKMGVTMALGSHLTDPL